MSNEATHVLHHGGGWITNIGNAFIDLGAIHSLREARDDITVHLASSFGRWTSKTIETGLTGRFLGSGPDSRNAYNLPHNADVKYVVQSGACLSEEWFETYGKSLVGARDGGAEVILYGVGAAEGGYSPAELEKTRDWLETIDPYALVSRDEQTYEAFQDVAEHTYNGIDCGFYVGDAFDPVPITGQEYVAVNFDKKTEPSIDTDTDTVRTHHSVWFPFALHRYPAMFQEYYGRENVLVSDVPNDYLNVYANAEATVSDRVHACVASYTFATPSRLVHRTNRASLFDRIGAGTITDEVVVPDLDQLEREKDEQVEFMAEILD